MLGYCPECDRLTAIRPKRRFEGGCLDYVTVPHDSPEELCKGSGQIVTFTPLEGGMLSAKCPECDEECYTTLHRISHSSRYSLHVVFLEGTIPKRKMCPGSGKVVK